MARYTAQQRQDLINSIAEGALIVGTGANRVQYRSLAEMYEVLANMDADLDADRPERNLRLSATQKGVNP